MEVIECTEPESKLKSVKIRAISLLFIAVCDDITIQGNATVGLKGKVVLRHRPVLFFTFYLRHGHVALARVHLNDLHDLPDLC